MEGGLHACSLPPSAHRFPSAPCSSAVPGQTGMLWSITSRGAVGRGSRRGRSSLGGRRAANPGEKRGWRGGSTSLPALFLPAAAADYRVFQGKQEWGMLLLTPGRERERSSAGAGAAHPRPAELWEKSAAQLIPGGTDGAENNPRPCLAGSGGLGGIKNPSLPICGGFCARGQAWQWREGCGRPDTGTHTWTRTHSPLSR